MYSAGKPSFRVIEVVAVKISLSVLENLILNVSVWILKLIIVIITRKPK